MPHIANILMDFHTDTFGSQVLSGQYSDGHGHECGCYTLETTTTTTFSSYSSSAYSHSFLSLSCVGEGCGGFIKGKLIIRLYREFTEDVFMCMHIFSTEVVLQSGDIFLAVCGGCIPLYFCSCIYVDLYQKVKYCYSAF